MTAIDLARHDLEERIREISDIRCRRPEAIGEAAERRAPPSRRPDGLFVLAADHPARGSLRAGAQPLAMADRRDLLYRVCLALSRAGVNGVLGTPDLLEDLLLLGALDGKHVFGSMNRGGIAGSAFEIDDRFTAYDAVTLKSMGFQGGKMLLRIDADDASTPRTLEACGHAIGRLAGLGLHAMVEPFMSRRVDGRLVNAHTPDAAIKAMSIAAGLGSTSAYTWLKVPVVDDLERVMAATTLPSLILGGEVKEDQAATLESWKRALALPPVMGLVVGRSLLYPPDDDVAAVVDAAASLVGDAARSRA